MQTERGVMELLANRWNDLKTRTLSSVAIATLALICIWIGGIIFSSLIILAAIILIKEWRNLTTEQPQLFYLLGYVYIILPCACILWLRELDIKLLFSLIAIISATDIGAYFVGKKFGRNKLAYKISPNKTWEGLAGGVASASIVALICSQYILAFSIPVAIISGAIIAVLAQIGDLFKSWIKRKAGVKNSGNILPGHGGLLDRLDGYMFTAPILALLVYYIK